MSDYMASPDFQFILRILGTNIDGRKKVMFALTAISGIGRRLSNILLKRAEIDMNKRAGELTPEEIEKIVTILKNPRSFKIPDWFLNRQRDIITGKTSQVFSNGLLSKLRDDLEGLKKIRAHRGLRHYWGLTVRGQHTKTSGRGRVQNALAKKK
eukprot:CAMPEP_0185577750 /NCGR_PEP_ID=MMETSP0434-20130131/10943_1 /TAXON_ID=626734 ORGANISM="Favella taraikaensis, Strain Fe Narragansett Bay" /NCGR_SAMPLE_ID=MMETSP0434 /ASSEMBLY_ACC=CAM_ASM_000379 /LENGTH=153 /DNA_ID=CAMNT_0028195403 /DNA_START=26 /DNA_END=487 /DNA_ORIENTATION=+